MAYECDSKTESRQLRMFWVDELTNNNDLIAQLPGRESQFGPEPVYTLAERTAIYRNLCCCSCQVFHNHNYIKSVYLIVRMNIYTNVYLFVHLLRVISLGGVIRFMSVPAITSNAIASSSAAASQSKSDNDQKDQKDQKDPTGKRSHINVHLKLWQMGKVRWQQENLECDLDVPISKICKHAQMQWLSEGHIISYDVEKLEIIRNVKNSVTESIQDNLSLTKALQATVAQVLKTDCTLTVYV